MDRVRRSLMLGFGVGMLLGCFRSVASVASHDAAEFPPLRSITKASGTGTRRVSASEAKKVATAVCNLVLDTRTVDTASLTWSREELDPGGLSVALREVELNVYFRGGGSACYRVGNADLQYAKPDDPPRSVLFEEIDRQPLPLAEPLSVASFDFSR